MVLTRLLPKKEDKERDEKEVRKVNRKLKKHIGKNKREPELAQPGREIGFSLFQSGFCSKARQQVWGNESVYSL